MGELSKRKRHQTTLMSIVMKAIFGIGMIVFVIALVLILFLDHVSKSKSITPQIYVNIEMGIMVGYLVIGLGVIVLISFTTARSLRIRGKSILEVTERIKNQDLDFQITPSGVKEIDWVLSGMEDMRTALKEALTKQWRLEQNRKEQISALVHDFKTPITVLKGNLDLLQGCDIAESSKDYYEDARAGLNQIEYYLSQLLEVTRAERGYQLILQKIEITGILEEIALRFSHVASDRDIKILVNKERDDIFVSADQSLLERVFQNLISNALDFTPTHGTIAIDLITEEDKIMITVTDTGCGFSQSALRHATEQFFMEDTSRSGMHYGMGLFIAASIISQHNGSIQLSNEEETGGARIRVLLPLIKD
jgi:signal transduction histidine kinase